MTDLKQIAEQLAQIIDAQVQADAILAALQSAVTAQRERDAAIARGVGEKAVNPWDDWDEGYAAGASDAADAIEASAIEGAKREKCHACDGDGFAPTGGGSCAKCGGGGKEGAR